LPSDLVDHPLASFIYGMSEGITGEAVSVMNQAAIRAINTGHEKIDLEILEQIHFVPPSARRSVNSTPEHYAA
jgi:hypothetical protein